METIDKIFYNGDILTLEDELYVEALMIRNDKIYKLGNKEDLIKEANDNVQLIDLQGKTLMPSFMDAHSHFSGYAISFTQVNLSEAVSFKEISEAIKEFIKKNNISEGQWIQAEGYDQNYLQEKIHPTKELLDEAAPNNPVLCKHKSGHMGVFNTLGLKNMGITIETENPEGGIIEKKNGKLTGYLEEAAYINYVKKLPMVSNEEFIGVLMKAQEAYASYGITTVQEGFLLEELAPIYEYLMQSKVMKIDLIGFIDISKADKLKSRFSNCLKKYHNNIKVGGYKTFLDGSPQGRTAWMRTPYLGSEGSYYGYGVQSDEELQRNLQLALKDNMQVLVHCNGDAACEQYINQYDIVKGKIALKNDIRPVIIHAQLLDRDQLDKVKSLNMIPSFFIPHVYYWGDVHINNYGKERASRISLAKDALDKKILFTFHQDAPVIEPNMLETIWCAVNRITKDGIVLGNEEKISPLEALKAVTINVAYQYFEENIKGSLKEGKLADLVILDNNILKVDPMDIKNINVVETIKEGKTIFIKN